MASIQKSLLVLAIAVAAAFAATAHGASYTVGEPRGSWDLQTNYTAWASSISFRLGDKLVFKYSPEAHDVVEVTKKGYLSCTASENISGTLRTGQDTVDLDRLRTRYFICSVQGHCAAGMKLRVKVVPPGCDSSSPPAMNGTPGPPGVSGTPGGGVCIGGDGPPTTISTSPSYSSAPGSSGSAASPAAFVIVAATLLLLGLVVS